ncbi:MAG: hypothetical protein VX498_14610, partial [Myxococcota bacterium]|nr:hypothetical protein [Myxococcota bacterium]
MPPSHRVHRLLRRAAVAACFFLLVSGSALAQEAGPGDCADGNDNDGDGAFDCGDSDCVISPDCASEDFDGDGAPNSLDAFPTDPFSCGDSDGDTCDDCFNIPGFQFNTQTDGVNT